MIVGLWQLSGDPGDDRIHRTFTGAAAQPARLWRYPQELERALRVLWRGSGGEGAGAATAERHR